MSYSLLDLLSKIDDKPAFYEFPTLSFSLREFADRIRRERFPTLPREIPIYFGKMKTIAFVSFANFEKPYVVINSVLNYPTVPKEIFDLIVTHEYLHLVVPGREIDGKMSLHPPEFFSRERELCSYTEQGWSWIYHTFGVDLVRDRAHEQTRIKNLRQYLKQKEFYSIAEVNEFDRQSLEYLERAQEGSLD